MKNTTLRVAIGTLVGATLALAAPLAASAHVTVNPSQAEPGSYSLLTFRVPNESETAGTVSLAVDLPQDTPFASVSYQPVPGWTTSVEEGTLDEPVESNGSTITEAATRVVWTADDGVQIAPGQFQQFTLSVGPVPEVGSITLAATQTYSDGTVVEWADEDEDADKPAPVLYITDAPAADHHGSASTEEETHDESGSDAASSTSTDDGLARGLGISALIVAALALVLGVYGAFLRRKA